MPIIDSEVLLTKDIDITNRFNGLQAIPKQEKRERQRG